MYVTSTSFIFMVSFIKFLLIKSVVQCAKSLRHSGCVLTVSVSFQGMSYLDADSAHLVNDVN